LSDKRGPAVRIDLIRDFFRRCSSALRPLVVGDQAAEDRPLVIPSIVAFIDAPRLNFLQDGALPRRGIGLIHFQLVLADRGMLGRKFMLPPLEGKGFDLPG
jgi:hypothetical protein